MGKAVLQMLLFISFATNISFAQNTLLAGRIVDLNNNPIAGAVIKVLTAKKIIKATADKDGLYYTTLFPAGKYNVRIYNNSQCYTAHDINITARDKEKKFYNFQLTGSNAIVDINEHDPFMAVALNNVDANPHLFDWPVIKRNKRAEYEDVINGGNGVWRVKYIPDSNELRTLTK